MAKRRIQTRGKRNKARADYLAEQHGVEKGTLTAVITRVKQQKRLLKAQEPNNAS